MTVGVKITNADGTVETVKMVDYLSGAVVSSNTVRKRLKMGWTLADALYTRARHKPTGATLKAKDEASAQAVAEHRASHPRNRKDI